MKLCINIKNQCGPWKRYIIVEAAVSGGGRGGPLPTCKSLDALWCSLVKKKTIQNHLSCGITLCFLIVTSFFLQILIIFGTIVKSQWFSQTPPPMNVCLKSDQCHQWNDNEFLEGQPLDTMEWQWFSMVPSPWSNDPSFRSSIEGPSFLQWTSAAVR